MMKFSSSVATKAVLILGVLGGSSLILLPVSVEGSDDLTLSMEDLMALQDATTKFLSLEDPSESGLMEAFDRKLQGFFDDDDADDEIGGNDPTRCGRRNPCAEGLTCMRLGWQKECVPLSCLIGVATNSVFDVSFYERLFETAGVTTEQVADAFLSNDFFRQDPYSLLYSDNAFSHLARAMHTNPPFDKHRDLLEQSMGCYSQYNNRKQRQRKLEDGGDCGIGPSKAGVTLLIGPAFAAGSVAGVDFTFSWGNGSADIDDSNAASFVPSTFFDFTVQGVAGIEVSPVTAAFIWVLTGTKEDVPGNVLTYGGSGAAGLEVGLGGGCRIASAIPSIKFNIGTGVGAAANLGLTRSCMIFNGTEIPAANGTAAPTTTRTRF